MPHVEAGEIPASESRIASRPTSLVLLLHDTPTDNLPSAFLPRPVEAIVMVRPSGDTQQFAY